MTITSVSDGRIIRNGRKNMVKEELVKLNEEMKELVKQIKVVANCHVKEVTQQKVKEMIGKMNCIIE
jgi:lipopolysaccharide biosynthesis protein